MLLTIAPAAACADPPDAAVYRLIDQLRESTAKLRIDGMDRDWRGVPEMTDPRGDAGGDASRDVTGVAIAPREDDLCVMIHTAGTPSTDRFVFYLVLDAVGNDGDNFEIILAALGQPPVLRTYGKDRQPGESIPLTHAKVAVRRVVEMRIPYRDMLAGLSAEQAELLTGPKARSWMRIKTQTWDTRLQRVVDLGPAAGSFRLLKTPYPLDGPLPPNSAEPVVAAMPVRGQWVVAQAAFGPFTHSKIWAYDLVKVNGSGRQSDPVRSQKNSDYFAWGQPVFAPAAGQVRTAPSDFDDVVPRGTPAPANEGNHVYIIASDRFGLSMGHFQKGSVTVKPGEQVTADQQVGLVGNSGKSLAPHLHVAAWGGVFRAKTVPIAFAKVRVGLNPVDNDPWARELDRWQPRYGFLVSP